jgi:hypothetical protein
MGSTRGEREFAGLDSGGEIDYVARVEERVFCRKKLPFFSFC